MNIFNQLILHNLIALSTAAGTGRDQQILRSNERHHEPYHLNFSSPAPLVFHSTFALLQQWPNTFFPNGHTIAPCTVPINTKLYHAHQNASFPHSPEWFAFDSAMAYSILGGLHDSHLLTFRTIREVRCLYFDGTSAALMSDGSMDSQMLVIHNNSAKIPESPPWRRPPPPPDKEDRGPAHGRPGEGPPEGNYRRFNPLQAEYDRAEGLCNFIKEKDLGGPGWGYEGIVRMNAAFEMIWCNFSSPSIQLASWLNVSSPAYEGINDSETRSMQDGPGGPPPRGRPPRPPGWNHPFRTRTAYEWFHAAANTYGFVGGKPGRGEARVKLDSCSLFSFYDPALEDQSRARIGGEKQAFNLSADGQWLAPEDEDDRKVALQRLARRRRYQRASNVSEADGLYMRSALEQRMRATLGNHGSDCSGIDWVLAAGTIVTEYASALYELETLLAQSPDSSNSTLVRHWLINLRGAAHQLIMPYYEYPPYRKETLHSSFSMNAPSSQAALHRCISHHNAPSTLPLSPSETLISISITTVLTAICHTLLPLFLSIETLWLKHFNNLTSLPPTSLQAEISHTAKHHHRRIDQLTAWLGWSEQWVDCNPGCSLGEICAIPIWPVMRVGHFSHGGFAFETPEEGEREMFRPRCVDGANNGDDG